MSTTHETKTATIETLRCTLRTLTAAVDELDSNWIHMTDGQLSVSAIVDEIGNAAVVCSAVTAVLCDSHPVDSLTDEQAVSVAETLRAGHVVQCDSLGVGR